MKKSFAIVFGLTFLALLDSLLSYAMPVDFQYVRLSIVWHFFFIAVMILVHDKPWLTRVLISALCGMLLDFFFNGSFPFDLLMYTLCGFLAGFFDPWLHRPKLAFVVYMFLCFLVDFVPWVWQSWQHLTNISFISWLYHIEMLTMIANAFEILLIMYVDLIMVRFFLIQKHRREKASRASMKKLRSAPKTRKKAKKGQRKAVSPANTPKRTAA